MDISDDYKKNIQNHIITYDMLDDALFAVNKRAKNWRNIKRERKKSIWENARILGAEIEDSAEEAEKMEELMYQKKLELLTVLPPVCIHKELYGYEKKIIYDNDSGYDNAYLTAIFHNAILEKGSIWKNKKCYNYILVETVPRYHYYLVRFMGDHAFHTPIFEKEIQNYDIPVLTTGKIKTVGLEEKYLASMEYVEAILELIRSGDYTYIDNEKKQEIREPFPVTEKKYEMLDAKKWKEVISVLEKSFPEYKELLKSSSINPNIWNKIINLKEITVDSCMRVVMEESKTAKHIIVKKRFTKSRKEEVRTHK